MSMTRRLAAALVPIAMIAGTAGCVAVNTPPVGRTTGKQPIVLDMRRQVAVPNEAHHLVALDR